MQLNTNYALELEKLLANLGDARPRLLLHACCAPCSSAVLEQLATHFDITILYYNPNIWPKTEHDRRAAELQRFVQQSGLPGLRLQVLGYQPAEFYEAVKGLESEPERGSRCTVCYRLRMEQAARYAAQNGYDWFCTTLSISPHKDAARINEIGLELQQAYGVLHLPNDFKKKNGYKRSLELSSQHALYRQDYCGCQFSAAARGITAGE